METKSLRNKVERKYLQKSIFAGIFRHTFKNEKEKSCDTIGDR